MPALYREKLVKKTVLINQPLSAAIAGLGHTDMLAVADAGLPIPAGPVRIDLAVSQGIPPFLDVLRAVLSEMQVQKAIIASEMEAASPALHRALLEALDGVPVETVSHETFKTLTRDAQAVARTGEFSPFANVLLVAGVVF